MEQRLNEILREALEKINQNDHTLKSLEEIRLAYLGKKGVLTEVMAGLRSLTPEEKPVIGQKINVIKATIENTLKDAKTKVEDQELLKLLESEKIDPTLPGLKLPTGSIHPLNQVIEDVEDLFLGLGYEVADGPELEKDLYNFEMMNIGKNHPARAMQDSFFVDEETLLRTHTSPVQARAMLAHKGKPLAIICPGKVYRRDNDDLTHSHQFMQIEGLVIDEHITFGHLKDTLLKMVRHLFGNEREIRLRPSYFPFTEPSVEVDVVWTKADGTKTYIEVLGAGLVHPDVLKMGGYDPDKFQGFAFGIGVERIAILKYHVEDIRNFYTNDIRFLKQFRGK